MLKQLSTTNWAFNESVYDLKRYQSDLVLARTDLGWVRCGFSGCVSGWCIRGKNDDSGFFVNTMCHYHSTGHRLKDNRS